MIIDLHKHVHRLESILQHPDHIEEIHLTEEDYEAIRKDIVIKNTTEGFPYETFLNYIVRCKPDISESMFVVMYAGPNYVPVRTLVRADLSYMDGCCATTTSLPNR